MNELGIYVHFPFCKRKCPYCDFYSQTDFSPAERYLSALIRHICSAGQDRPVDSVFFGGGTPSLMSGGQVASLLDALRQSFPLTPDCEITLETNPCACDEERLLLYREAGVNRISLGVQSLDDRELASIGRLHSRKDALRAVSAAERAGFLKISLDLMYGLPGQTLSRFETTLREALTLPVQHLSVYGLTIEKNTPFGKRGRESLSLPDEGEEAEMYERACALLGQAGFEHYEISNFALPGNACRHNLKYWHGEEYLGFGAAAHSYFNGARYSYPESTEAYLRAPVPVGTERITEEQRQTETILLSLRLGEGLDYTRLCRPPTGPLLRYVDRLCAHRLAQKTACGFSLTERGFYLSNTIIAEVLRLAGC